MKIPVIKIFVIFLTGFLQIFSLKAETKDSIKSTTYKTQELTIQSTKHLSKEAYRFNSTILIERSEIESHPNQELSSILQTSPGFYINDYGGIGGMKTVSIRGSSGSQTQININGIPINSNQNGIFDLSLFPTYMIQSLELSRGGLSSDANNNALSGIVDIQIAPNYHNIFNSSINYGSFNQFNLSINYNPQILNSNSSFFINAFSGDGNFTYQNTENLTLERENSDFSSLNLMFVNDLKFDNFQITPLILFKYDEKGLPGEALRDRTINSEARLDKKYILTGLSSVNQINDSTLFSFSSSFSFDEFHFTNEKNSLNNDNKFFNRNLSVGTYYKRKILFSQFKIGINYEFASLNGNFLNKSIGDYVSRNVFSSFVNWLIVNENKSFKTDIFASAKLNSFEGFYPKFTQNIGLISNYKKLPVFFKLNFSNNYRIPSFNELYYLNYGNTSLKPEESFSLNTSLLFDLFEFFKFEITAYRQESTNLILSVPKSPFEWSAQNIGKTISNGIELYLNSEFREYINFNIAYTLQETTDESMFSATKGKLIPYIPQEVVSVSLFSKYKFITLGTVINYSSHRFALPDNSYESVLDSYAEVDFYINLQKEAFFPINLKFGVNNLTNQTFSIIKNFPMPGRNFYIQLGYKL